MVKAFTLASLLATILLVKAATIPNHERTSSNGMKLNITKPQALAPPSADCLTESWAPLSRKKSGKPYSKAMMAMHMVNGDVPTALLDSSDGVEYLLPVFWNDQEFQAVLDTGSSDTWLISHNFTCINYAGREVEQALCAFGPGYSGTFTENPDLDFYISYGSGEYVIGNIGTVPMGIAGITVPEQTVALGTEAYWRGLGVASGLGIILLLISTAFY